MSDEKRYTPSISLKESERDWIKKQAKKAGISYTNYMRKVVLGELPQATPFHKKNRMLEFKNGVTQEDMRRVLNYDLPKLGNNLNQLARHVNETRDFGIKQLEELKEYRAEIAKIGRKILRGLG